MAPFKQLVSQTIALFVGFLLIIICLFLVNGVADEGTEFEVDVTYSGKLEIYYQGIKYSIDLECDPEAMEERFYKDCQLYAAAFNLAKISLVFGWIALALVVSKQIESLRPVYQRFKICVEACIGISRSFPLFFEIFMPTWKIIHSQKPELTYKIIPVILEITSFILYLYAFIVQGIEMNKTPQIGLLQ